MESIKNAAGLIPSLLSAAVIQASSAMVRRRFYAQNGYASRTVEVLQNISLTFRKMLELPE